MICPDCGREGIKQRGMKMHQQRYCSANEDLLEAKPAQEVAPEKVAHIAHGLDLIPNKRMTYAWFFRPPVVHPEFTTVTGLPEDCFYTADAWDAAHVEKHRRKFATFPDGRIERHRLVCPVDAHGMTVKSVPFVALRPPDFSEEDRVNWLRIQTLMEEARLPELEKERAMIESAEADMEFVTGQAQRTGLRERIANLKRRVQALEAGPDWDALYNFFANESERSIASLRTPEQRLGDLIDGRIAQAVG